MTPSLSLSSCAATGDVKTTSSANRPVSARDRGHSSFAPSCRRTLLPLRDPCRSSSRRSRSEWLSRCIVEGGSLAGTALPWCGRARQELPSRGMAYSDALVAAATLRACDGDDRLTCAAAGTRQLRGQYVELLQRRFADIVDDRRGATWPPTCASRPPCRRTRRSSQRSGHPPAGWRVRSDPRPRRPLRRIPHRCTIG
jgi:hypothetical protein